MPQLGLQAFFRHRAPAGDEPATAKGPVGSAQISSCTGPIPHPLNKHMKQGWRKHFWYIIRTSHTSLPSRPSGQSLGPPLPNPDTTNGERCDSKSWDINSGQGNAPPTPPRHILGFPTSLTSHFIPNPPLEKEEDKVTISSVCNSNGTRTDHNA